MIFRQGTPSVFIRDPLPGPVQNTGFYYIMNDLTSRLLVYGDLGDNSILKQLSLAFDTWDKGTCDAHMKPHIVRSIYDQIKRLLDLATDYGFNRNLWQDYLTFVLMTNENSFSLVTERGTKQHGSIDLLVKADFEIFRQLFHYDFSGIEEDLGIDCFSIITDYHAIDNKKQRYNKSVSDMVRGLSDRLSKAADADAFYDIITDQYLHYGVGMIGLNAAFRVRPLSCDEASGSTASFEQSIFSNADDVALVPIYNLDRRMLSDLVGYEQQKEELRRNTEAFLDGKASNNILLYGDAGTGKSSSVKALISEYYDRGLRMIEIYKHQFRDLSAVIARIKNRNFRFIIFIDDLSFEENEVEYKFLKAVIEGGVENWPENVVIYATSNRRHLIRETWNDRTDMEHNEDIHRSDTVEEKLSLSARFGVRIFYPAPRHAEFQNIVLSLARRKGLDPAEWPDERILQGAISWERRAGGPTGRVAEQYITYILSEKERSYGQ